MKSNLSARERSGDPPRHNDARPTRTLGRGLRAVAVTGVLFLVGGPVAAIAEGCGLGCATRTDAPVKPPAGSAHVYPTAGNPADLAVGTENGQDVVSDVGDSLPAHSEDVAKPVLDEVEQKLGTGSTSDPSGEHQSPKPRDPSAGTNHSPVNHANDPTPNPKPGRNTGRAKTGSESKHGGDTLTGARHANASNGTTTGADHSDPPGDVRPLPRTSPSHAIGRWNPPSDDEPGANQTFVPNPPAGRTAIDSGARSAIARIAGALRFPTVLVALLVVFLTLQQRADRRDPKLAQAPVRGGQDWLEFR
jgi:hypothetical protein